MNRKNILRVADAIEKGELVKRGIGFNMANYVATVGLYPDRIDGCGTVACIAGWSYVLSRRRVTAKALLGLCGVSEIYDGGQEWLDLTDTEADNLFIPYRSLSSITPAHAVAVLRHLAETGEVDWSIGAP